MQSHVFSAFSWHCQNSEYSNFPPRNPEEFWIRLEFITKGPWTILKVHHSEGSGPILIWCWKGKEWQKIKIELVNENDNFSNIFSWFLHAKLDLKTLLKRVLFLWWFIVEEIDSVKSIMRLMWPMRTIFSESFDVQHHGYF